MHPQPSRALSRAKSLAPRGLLHLLLAASLLPACKAPRDPDLERRISEAKVTRALPAAPKDEQPAHNSANNNAPKTPDNPYGLPPAGSVELRPYDDKEIAKILSAVPRRVEDDKPKADERYEVRIKTTLGDILCTLDHQEAPQASANFIALALGKRAWRDPDTKDIAKSPFYKGLTFHRTIKDFIIQRVDPGRCILWTRVDHP